VLQCVAVCCSVLQRVDTHLNFIRKFACWPAFRDSFVLSCLFCLVALCCSMVQYVTVKSSVLQCGAVCCSVLQCVAVCCSVLQCVAAASC